MGRVEQVIDVVEIVDLDEQDAGPGSHGAIIGAKSYLILPIANPF